MKIVRFSLNGHTPRLGCFVGGDRVMDLAASGAAYLASRGVVRAEAIADALYPQSTRGFLEGGSASQDITSRHFHVSHYSPGPSVNTRLANMVSPRFHTRAARADRCRTR